MRVRNVLSVAVMAGAVLTVSAGSASAGVVNDLLEDNNPAEYCVGFDSDENNPKLNENNITGVTYYPDLYVNSVDDCLDG